MGIIISRSRRKLPDIAFSNLVNAEVRDQDVSFIQNHFFAFDVPITQILLCVILLLDMVTYMARCWASIKGGVLASAVITKHLHRFAR